MSNAPVLILQMQRMGDLILTFPLMGWLQQHAPEHPLWVVSEPSFFQELMELAPKAVFFPPEAAECLISTTYHTVINLSHRPDAARLCGALQTERRIGPYIRGQASYIEGFWQLYRASIVHNNRHNRFHWGDLNLLDVVPLNTLATLRHPAPESPSTAARGCVGLFVGASEPDKRPDPLFWGTLAKLLLRKGIRPLFFGGPDDKHLAEAAEQVSGITGCNLCGRFSLTQLAHAMRALDLCITPDTGPMHLAAWIGTPVLNLSMGPVNAWETGPIAMGHHVLRPTASCSGCWRCGRSRPICRDAFRPGPVATVIHALLTERERLPRTNIPGVALYRTGRDTLGLYTLHHADGKTASPRDMLSAFWQTWFLNLYAPDEHMPQLSRSLTLLAGTAPELISVLRRTTLALSTEITRQIRWGGAPLTRNFWKAHPSLLRPLTSYLHLRLQNEEYSAAGWRAALDMVAQLSVQLERL